MYQKKKDQYGKKKKRSCPPLQVVLVLDYAPYGFGQRTLFEMDVLSLTGSNFGHKSKCRKDFFFLDKKCREDLTCAKTATSGFIT